MFSNANDKTSFEIVGEKYVQLLISITKWQNRNRKVEKKFKGNQSSENIPKSDIVQIMRVVRSGK